MKKKPSPSGKKFKRLTIQRDLKDWITHQSHQDESRDSGGSVGGGLASQNANILKPRCQTSYRGAARIQDKPQTSTGAKRPRTHTSPAHKEPFSWTSWVAMRKAERDRTQVREEISETARDKV